MSQDADISQLSNKDFLSSLGDEELIDFISNWSQRQREKERLLNGPREQSENEIPLQIPSLETNSESSFSFPLAQPQQEEQEPDNVVFADYRSYFATKGRNQQLEDEKYLEWDQKRRKVQGLDTTRSEIFKSCVIYVNGHTRPSIATLHRLVILNGGKFIHHLSSKGAATHVIASRLTPRKHLEFRNYKVVKPEWITESIEQGMLQRWTNYTIIEVDYGQKRLPFQLKDDVMVEDGSEIGDIDSHKDGNDNDLEEKEVGSSTLPGEEQQPSTDEMIVIDSRHPDFLKSFFAKSRLHHLSTWKADLRAEFLNMVVERSKSQRKPTNITKNRIIIHVDFDSFFAAASALNRPDIDFKTTPVCVSHGGSKASSTADIASCNYVCRKFGVKNGMWVGSAKKICPDLVCLDYDFQSYEKISKRLYEILMDQNPDCILPVSIDEALLDITSLIDGGGNVDIQVTDFLKTLRSLIFEETECTVSIGASSNVLLAKLALRSAKPDGLFYLKDNLEEFLSEVPVAQLPGVGGAIIQKLNYELFPYGSTEKTATIQDLKSLDRGKLEKVFGKKTGTKLYEYARGIDNTSIDIAENPQEFMRKSVSIDINWGIRFNAIDQIDDFLFRVAKEICSKLEKIHMCASQVTLKILKRAKGAPIDPPKYLGCGRCDAFSKSSKLGIPTDEYRTIGMEARILFRNIGCDPLELRGVSIQVTKLSEKRKDNQKRLPYTKIDYETFKRQKLEAERQEKAQVLTNLTQFDIPNEIDSSILDQLPSSVKNQIKEQHDRNLAPVAMIPKDVDLEVFQQLPEEIQEELKEELRRRNIRICPKTPRKDRKIYLQQVFTQGGGAGFVRVISPKKSPRKSPSKKFKGVNLPRATSVCPQKVEKPDEEVFKELPLSLREQIMKEWEEHEEITKTEFERLKERIPAALAKDMDCLEELSINHFTRKREPLSFQKRVRPSEILKLVDTWITRTSQKGPHKRDLELFQEFMSNLRGSNSILYKNIVQRMLLLSRIEHLCDKWVYAIDTYR
jgi:DNA repair protein REV1